MSYKKNYAEISSEYIEKDYLLGKEHFKIIEHLETQNDLLIKILYQFSINNTEILNNIDFTNNLITKNKISIGSIIKNNPTKNKIILTDVKSLDNFNENIQNFETLKIQSSKYPVPTNEQIQTSSLRDILMKIRNNEFNLMVMNDLMAPSTNIDFSKTDPSKPLLFALINIGRTNLTVTNKTQLPTTNQTQQALGQATKAFSTNEGKMGLNIIKDYLKNYANKPLIRKQMINMLIAQFEITYGMSQDIVRNLLRKILEINEEEPFATNEAKIKKILDDFFPNFFTNDLSKVSLKNTAIILCFILEFNLINFTTERLNRIEIKKAIDDPNLKFKLDVEKLNQADKECPKCVDKECPKPICNCPKLGSCPDCNCDCGSNKTMYVVIGIFILLIVLALIYNYNLSN